MSSETTFEVKRDELELVMERRYDAPRELVWKAFTDPELISQWWGPGTKVEKMDVSEGGAWRFILQSDPSGQAHPFNGVYKEIDPPRSLTNTFNYEPYGPGHELTETAKFEELESGETKVVSISTFNSVEDLDGMIDAGMESGARESYDRLDKLLQTMQ